MACCICRAPISRENVKVQLQQHTTTHTNTALIAFIARITAASLDETGEICVVCLAIINDLDYMQKRCEELKGKLLLYIEEGVNTKCDMALNVEDNLKCENVLTEETNNAQISQNEEIVTKLDGKKRGRKKLNSDVLKPYKCDQCEKTWKTSNELKMHVQTHNELRPFICEVCGQAYKHKSALNIHLGMHKGINPFTCIYCNKSFTQKGALQRHMPIHTGECPYQCDLCGKRFVHHTSFNIHQLTHSGQKDYKCEVCGMALMSGSHLKRHMRAHTGEKNFECTVCGKRFAERYNLVSHQKLHDNDRTNKKNNKCKMCELSFGNYHQLNEHVITDHQSFNYKRDFELLWQN